MSTARASFLVFSRSSRVVAACAGRAAARTAGARSMMVQVSKTGGGPGSVQQSRDDTAKPLKCDDSLEGLPPQTVSALTGVPLESLRFRTAKIYRPTATTMQDGNGEQNRHWVIEFDRDTTTQRATRLMGWIGSDNALSSVKLEFSTADEAVRAAKRLGFSYEVVEFNNEQNATKEPKSYEKNFKFKAKADEVEW